MFDFHRRHRRAPPHVDATTTRLSRSSIQGCENNYLTTVVMTTATAGRPDGRTAAGLSIAGVTIAAAATAATVASRRELLDGTAAVL